MSTRSNLSYAKLVHPRLIPGTRTTANQDLFFLLTALYGETALCGDQNRFDKQTKQGRYQKKNVLTGPQLGTSRYLLGVRMRRVNCVHIPLVC